MLAFFWLAIMLMGAPATLVAACPSALHSNGFDAVQLSPDGMKIAAAASDGTVFIWDVKSGKRTTLADCLPSSAVIFSADSSHVALSDTTGALKVLDLSNLRLIELVSQNIREGDEANLNAADQIVFSSDGRRLAAHDPNGIRMWSLDSGNEIMAISGERRAELVALNHNGMLLARGGYGSLTLWDAVNNRAIRTITLKADDLVESIMFAHNDRWLISALSGKGIVVWDTETGSRVKTFRGQTGHLVQPLMLTDSGALFSAADDGTLRSWDLETGQIRNTWYVSSGLVGSNGQLVLELDGSPGQVQVWRIDSASKEARSFIYKSPLCAKTLSGPNEPISEKQLEGFRNVGMGELSAGDGTDLSFTNYLAPDCNTISITHGEFKSAVGAREELKRKSRRALRVIEQGPNRDFFGNIIGERALLVFSETNGIPTTAAVIWTDGKRYFESVASSLPLVQAFEKGHRH